MENELIERAARAHYEASHDMRVEIAWADCHPDYRAQEIRAMRAAIEAMREPTEAMLDASAVKARGMTFSDYPRKQDATLYRAMIDAALKEPA